MARQLKSIECSAQPLCMSFHPFRDVVAAGLVDGTVEVHDLVAMEHDHHKEVRSTHKVRNKSMDDDSDDDLGTDSQGSEQTDSIISSIFVAKESTAATAPSNTKMLAKLDAAHPTAAARAAQGPSCRCVRFSNPATGAHTTNQDAAMEKSGGENLFTACNGGSLRCLDSELVCSLQHSQHLHSSSSSPVLWSVENAHNVGISKLYQLPHASPCGPLLATGDDVGVVRLWDGRICNSSGGKNKTTKNADRSKQNPFDNLMKPPAGCVMQWKVNHDYISDFESNNDGTTLFASSADGTLSVFDVRFVNRKNTPLSVILPDIDWSNHTLEQQQQHQQQKQKQNSWEKSGYVQSDNQEDELLSLCLIKNSQKLLCGSQQGILSLFSYNLWGDITDRFPGHPQSVDAILKIDEDTVLTGSSDGLVRAVQLLPNALLGVLGSHEGFPVEALQWSAGRKMVGSLSHDEYIRLWDGSFLNEDESGQDIMEEVSEESAAGGSQAEEAVAGKDDQDEWEDLDDDEEMEDSNDDSDDSDEDTKKPKKRANMFKNANEEFFQDL
ncbi:hypothetical protein HJC23_004693 [Cyclotella cryptica]|uniref:Uncharacterized protein n=1 Tax=Cyclotella cryptica TaxID=29204 RepID=A0ABD3PLM9_9STRA|eukprot:CCRYP_013921-RA/>CCRYP_013921-RA protein AED:0.04 eAED:0.04 QI:125/1/1/1/1/1/2/246/551